MRDAVDDSRRGATVLVGGGSAINYDFDQANERDLKLIVPLALLVIAIILAILLRAIVAPLVLIASVVILSFFGTLGISILFIRYVVGDAGIDNSIPTFAFIFLVALGIDYTIFLMSRVREEAREHGTREGMLRAIARHRAGDHERRDHPRRHVLGAHDPAGHVHLRPRLHGRARDPARHLRRPDDHGPGGGRADRRQDLVALDRRRGHASCSTTAPRTSPRAAPRPRPPA